MLAQDSLRINIRMIEVLVFMKIYHQTRRIELREPDNMPSHYPRKGGGRLCAAGTLRIIRRGQEMLRISHANSFGHVAVFVGVSPVAPVTIRVEQRQEHYGN